MALSLNTNLMSLQAQRQQGRSRSDLGVAIARLSSGLRINGAADDAAGLAIADRFTAQIRGTTQAGRNANDGISLAQTAEGALASIDANLQRIRELAVQSANATNSASDRASLQLEVAQLQSEIDRVATQTQFNGVNLLDGSFTAKQFQVGANVGQTISVAGVASARAGALGVFQGVRFHTDTGAAASNATAAFAVAIGGGPTISMGTITNDAKSQADAVNAAGIPGFTATTTPTTIAGVASSAAASSSGTATYTVNGLAISVAGVSGAAALVGNRAAAVAAINSRSAATGVVATDNGSAVDLVAVDGRNVTLSYAAGSFTGSSAADFGLSAAPITGGGDDFDYVAPAGVSGLFHLTLGIYYADVTIGTRGSAIGAIDISTVAGANAALQSVDAALQTVSGARASLGAVQNRFTAAIGSLQTATENLSASRSRTQDADFALETTHLARAQVLQQAGTAMIAQANQSAAGVLALLKG